MLDTALTVMVGLLGGIAVGLQAPIVGAMSQRVGGASSSLVVHLSGAFFSCAWLLVRGGERLQGWRSLPWYMLASGGFGLLLYLTLSRTLPRLGATAALALIIVGQLLGAMTIDQFGLFGIPARPGDASRVLAALLLMAGGYLAVR